MGWTVPRCDRMLVAGVVMVGGRLVVIVRSLLIAIVGLGMLTSGVPQSAAALGPVDPVAVDRFIEAQLRRHGIPGMTLAIIEDGRVTYVQGYGTAGAGRGMEATTAMPIGSMTKPFTAVAVLQLVEAGVIDLDAPVQRYVPWFEVADPVASRTITVRHLLNHTSGLSDLGYGRLLPADTTLEDGVRDLRHARQTALTGQAYQYFNPNYAVLAVLLQEVTGRPYADVVGTGILDPLGMADSTADPSAATGGLAEGRIKMFGLAIPADAPVRRYRDGADNIISTSPDLARFAMAVSAPSATETTLLSPASLQAMAAPPPGIEGATYGMGWEVSEHRGEPTVGHGGLDPTFSGQIQVLPKRGSGYVLLTNQGHLLETLVVGPQLREGLLDLLTGREPAIGGLPWRVVGLLLFAVFAVVLFFGVRTLIRLPRWRQRAPELSVRRRVWEIGSHFLMAALLVLMMYRLIPMMMGRTFNLREIGLYHLPDLTLLVAVSVLTDLIAGGGMLVMTAFPPNRRGATKAHSAAGGTST